MASWAADIADCFGDATVGRMTGLALREAAHVRLFQAAAWLPGTLHALVERYSAGIRIDLDALDSAVREAGHGDPSTLQQALTKGIFTPHADDEQQATLASIETLLALIEGWVQDVVTRAAAPHVAQVGALGEMMQNLGVSRLQLA